MSTAGLIAAMMAVTFAPRVLPLLLADRLVLPPLLERALGYVPIAVLSAIVALTAAVREGELALDWRNPFLLATAVTTLVARADGRLSVSVVAGLLSFVLLSALP